MTKRYRTAFFGSSGYVTAAQSVARAADGNVGTAAPRETASEGRTLGRPREPLATASVAKAA
jgi:hypothetical protein